MKYLLVMIFFVFLYLNSFSQKAVISKIDTLILNPIAFNKTVVLSENGVSILTSYQDFKRLLLNLKRNVFTASYLKDRKKDIKSVLNQIEAKIANNDTIFISQNLRDLIGNQFIWSYLSDKIEMKKAVILDENMKPHFMIIREKSSYQKDFLDGWGGRKYYLLKTNFPFFIRTDWVS